VAVVLALVRIRARRRWLDRVGAGSVRGWRLVDGVRGAESLPYLVRTAYREPQTLVRVHDAGQPFREGDTYEPIALVSTIGHLLA
jgi:hypothetical protein